MKDVFLQFCGEVVMCVVFITFLLGQNTRSGGDASMHGWRRDPQIFMRCKWRRGILSAAGKKVEEDIIIFIGGYINTLTHIVAAVVIIMFA